MKFLFSLTVTFIFIINNISIAQPLSVLDSIMPTNLSEVGKKEECTYVDGKREGIYRKYWEKSKNPISESFYEKGILNGKSITYWSDGIICSEVGYINGQLQGIAKYYDNKGRLSFEEFYVDGVRSGKTQFYFPNGKVEAYFIYKNGISGDHFIYHKKGYLWKLIKVDSYGKRLKIIFYNKKGEIIKEELIAVRV
jgi:antitoxin component YwqK of YwqJK toxin-antitoxin module